MAEFISVLASTTTGTLGALPRIPVLCTREDVTGYTADPNTGLIKINDTDLDTFITENPTSYGLINALTAAFNQVYTYPYVFILSAAGGITDTLLTKANSKPRDWSFLTLVSQYQGGGNAGSDASTYFADLEVIATWATPVKQKIVVHTYSIEEIGDNPIVLPAQLLLGGAIGANGNVKTVVSNSQHNIGPGSSYVTTYDNVALAWLAYCINSAISRSWGSLSDAHDFGYVESDTFSIASHSVIANASLAQYNGDKDRAGSLFVYDTQMNDDVNPSLADQIETLAAGYYIQDYIYVLVHNTYQQAGQLGLPTDDAGIQNVLGTVNKGLRDCFFLNLILGKEDGSPDFSVAALTAAQVTILSPNWQTTGVWPSGVIKAKIKRFAALHYVVLNFAF